MLWKKTESPLFVDSVFFQLWKKTESTKSGDSVFLHSIFLPCLGLCFFSELKIFGLLSPSLPLVCWSQGFGYGFLACNGIIICTRPNVLGLCSEKEQPIPQWWELFDSLSSLNSLDPLNGLESSESLNSLESSNSWNSLNSLHWDSV